MVASEVAIAVVAEASAEAEVGAVSAAVEVNSHPLDNNFTHTWLPLKWMRRAD